MTLSAVIEVGLDGSKVAEGVAPITRTLENFGKTAQRVGQEAGAAMGKVGDGADKSSAKIEAATRNMISSLERRIAAATATAAGGEREYLEIIARQRGINLERINPYLKQLDDLKNKQVAVGMSAAAMNNAMRNVPAQFTDIVVSLQGGQKPMTVLLQQGGQLKDMFGGIGPAAKALGGYITGMITPVGLAAAAIAGLGATYYFGAQEAVKFKKQIAASGGAAGLSANQMIALSERISAIGVGTQSLAVDSLNAMLSAGNISSSVMEKAAIAGIKAQKSLGMSIEDSAKQFSELAKTPSASIEKLNDKYHFLTLEIYRQIKALEDQGKTAEAAQLAQSSYADALIGRSQKVTDTLTEWERGWERIKRISYGALDGVFDFGREDSSAKKIEKLLKEREGLKARRADNDKRGEGAYYGGLIDTQLAQNEKLINQERAKLDLVKEKAAAIEKANIATDAGIKFDREGEKFLSKEAKMIRDIAEARGLGAQAGLRQSEIEERVAAIREKAEDKAKTTAPRISKEVSAYDTLIKSIHEKIAASQLEMSGYSQLSESQKETIKLDELVATAKKKGQALNVDEARTQLQILSANERINKETEFYIAQAKAKTDASSALIKSAEDEAAKQEDLAKYFGLSKSAIDQLQIARLEEQLAQKGGIEACTAETVALNALIEAKKRSALASANFEQQDAIKKSKESMNAEWKKSVEQYDDIFRKGFAGMVNGGKDAWSSFTTSLVTTFKTSVADQIYKMFAQPFVVKMVGSMMGVFGSDSGVGSAAAASGAAGGSGSMFGSSMSMLSAGKTLWQGFSTAGGGLLATAGSAITSGGSALGLTSVSQFGSGLTAGTGAFLGQGATVAGSATGTGALASSAGAAGASSVSWIPIAGWIAAGMMTAHNLQKQGWDSGNMGGLSNTGKVLGSGTLAVDSLLRGLGMSSTLANIFSGQSTIARIFGRKAPEVRAFGIEGTIGASGLAGNTYQNITEKGGWFRSDKNYTKTGAIEASTQAMFDESTKSIIAASKGFGAALGVDASVIDGYSKQIKLAFGSDEKANQEQVTKLFSGIADELSMRLVPSLTSMSKTGETSSQTLQRLSGDLTATNLAMKALGLATYAVSIDGAKGAESLITLFGSLQDLQTASSSYYDNFYSDAEKLKLNTSLVADAFAAAGKTMPGTREALRAMVETAKSAGDESSYASLIKLSSAFASVVAATDTTTAALQAKAKAEANANERAGLSKELMQQMNDVVGLRKLELDAIDASNRGLKQQIYDLQDKQKAEELAAASAQKLVDSWQSITDSLVSEITRIKGLIGGDSAQSYAGAQSQFAVTTAQARAGDQNAAKLLPQLSQTMLAMAEQNAASAFDLLRIREMTAASLAATATDYKKYGVTLPSFDIGTDYVPEDQIAKIHRGERITPAAYNRSDVTNADLVAEIKMLNEKVAQLIAINARTEVHARGSADVLDRVTNGGAVMMTEAA
jgi:phage-related minor tail protein